MHTAVKLLPGPHLSIAHFIIAAFALAATLHAQDPVPTLAPELAPLAAKYQADLAALNAQNVEALNRVAQAYGTALDTAEKVETTAGHVAAIAAITAERAALNKEEVKSEIPKDLPKSLSTARKTYFDGDARVAADFGQRQQRIVADYLRALAALQTRATPGTALAKQITGEKERVLKAGPVQLQIVSAMCGDPATKRLVNVTKRVQQLYTSEAQPVLWTDFPPDPAPGVMKSVIVTYTINGQNKKKIFSANEAVNLPEQLR